MTEWSGDTPYFLIFTPPEGVDGNVGIDVDAPGWIEANKPLFRATGTWFLARKEDMRPVFCVLIDEGDQFFFVKHHVGNLMAGREVVAIGMGKKTSDGVPVNLWLFPNGIICGGDDVDGIASRMI